VHRCRRRVFGEDDAAGKAWAAALLHTLKHEGYEAAWDHLTSWRSTLRRPTQKQAADRLLNYVNEHRDMIDDPPFQSRGWQIGSGPTESRCKTSTHRLKGRGRRWDPANAEAVAALTTLQDSYQWHHSVVSGSFLNRIFYLRPGRGCAIIGGDETPEDRSQGQWRRRERGA
jgi:hypothetical protein